MTQGTQGTPRCECFDECYQDHGLQCRGAGTVEVRDVTGSVSNMMLCKTCAPAYYLDGPWEVVVK